MIAMYVVALGFLIGKMVFIKETCTRRNQVNQLSYIKIKYKKNIEEVIQ